MSSEHPRTSHDRRNCSDSESELFELPEHWPRVDENVYEAITLGEVERPARRPVITNGKGKVAGHILMLDNRWVALGPRGRGYGVYKTRTTAVCAVISCYKAMLAESIRLRAEKHNVPIEVPADATRLPLIELERLDKRCYRAAHGYESGKRDSEAYWSDFHYGPEATQRRVMKHRAQVVTEQPQKPGP